MSDPAAPCSGPAADGPTRMTILLTGASGFVGSNVAAELERRALDWRPLKSRLENIARPEMNDVSAVIHCAGQIPKGRAERSDYLRTNAAGTRALLKLCGETRVRRFIHISTMGVKFASHYAESKLAAEETVRKSGLEWLVLRLAHVYGPNAELAGHAARMRRKRLWPVVGLGDSPLDMVYVRDCATSIVDAAMSDTASMTFNVIDAGKTEMDYVRALRRAVSRRVVFIPTPVVWWARRKGKSWIEIRRSGLRIPGVMDWPFEATPLERGISESLLRLGSDHAAPGTRTANSADLGAGR